MPKDSVDLSTWSNLESTLFDCKQCARLVAWREEVAIKKRRAYASETYWAKPVPGLGDPDARVLVIGLAPGAHGSNRTGRMFTGDASGDFLFPALFRSGFANQPDARARDDSLKLKDLYISAVCRCAPPDNQPAPVEIATCQQYLEAEMKLLSQLKGIVCLGKISFEQTLKMLLPAGADKSSYPFKHLANYQGKELPYWVVASYHPSRQNTQTGRLTREMFDAVWQQVRINLTTNVEKEGSDQ